MTLEPIVKASCEQLQLAIDVLTTLTGRQYRSPDPLISGASVGQHWRHLSDHYACFLAGLSNGCVDYGERGRDTRTETDLAFALQEMSALIPRLGKLAHVLDGPLKVRHEPADVDTSANASSVARELEFLFSHSSHHLAMIAVVLRQAGIKLPVEFGLAASTRRYRAAGQISGPDISGQPA